MLRRRPTGTAAECEQATTSGQGGGTALIVDTVPGAVEVDGLGTTLGTSTFVMPVDDPRRYFTNKG